MDKKLINEEEDSQNYSTDTSRTHKEDSIKQSESH